MLVCINIYTCVSICMYHTSMYASIINVHPCMCVFVCARTCEREFMCISACVCLYVYMYMYMYSGPRPGVIQSDFQGIFESTSTSRTRPRARAEYVNRYFHSVCYMLTGIFICLFACVCVYLCVRAHVQALWAHIPLTKYRFLSSLLKCCLSRRIARGWEKISSQHIDFHLRFLMHDIWIFFLFNFFVSSCGWLAVGTDKGLGNILFT